MTPPRTGRVFALLIVAAAPALVLLAHCDDVTPLDYVAPMLDVEVPDQVNESRVEACRACASGDGGACAAQYAMCAEMDPRCPTVFDCLTDSYCWADFDRNNLTVLPPCAVACFDDAGVVSINQIAAAAAGIFFCVEPPGACSSVCTNATAESGTSEAPSD